MVGCHDLGALVWILSVMKVEWLGFGTLRLIRNMEVDPVLELITVVRVAEVDWAELPDDKWFPYDYAQVMPVLRPGGVTVGQNAGEGEFEGYSQFSGLAGISRWVYDPRNTTGICAWGVAWISCKRFLLSSLTDFGEAGWFNISTARRRERCWRALIWCSRWSSRAGTYSWRGWFLVLGRCDRFEQSGTSQSEEAFTRFVWGLPCREANGFQDGRQGIQLSEELILGEGSGYNATGSDTQVGCFCELLKKLHDALEVTELEKLQQKGEHSCDD